MGKPRATSFLALVLATAWSHAASCEEPIVVDAIVDQIYKQLAMRRGLTLVAAPETTDVQIGALYYITEPACEAELYRWRGTEKSLQLYSAISAPRAITPTLPVSWTTVRITTLLGAEASGTVSAKGFQQTAEAAAAFKALNQTNAEFSYAVLEAPSVTVRNSVAEILLAHSISDPRDVSGDATGLISPHAQLLIQNFIYDRRTVKGRRASITARIMEAVSGALKAGQERSDDYGFRNPTYAVAAIKPLPFLFRCPIRSSSSP